MKWIACLALAAGCQADARKSSPPHEAADPAGTTIVQLPKAALTAAYKADIATLCDCVRLSGADQKPKGERWTVVAMWLGPNIKTSEGHDFLVAIQPLTGETKALALETEAKRTGLPRCELASEWRRGG
jgi:hypothetical protein